MTTHVCRFEPWGVEVEAENLETVLSAARKGGVPLEAICGGNRACGTCAVEVLEGRLEEPDEEERAIIKGRSFRLGCRARIAGDVVVRPLVGRASRAPEKNSMANESVREFPSLDVKNAYVGIDIGTTNVKVALRTDDGLELRSTVSNSQSSWGADVVSRLSAALADEHTAKALQETVSRDAIEALQSLQKQASERSACDVHIQHTVIAANTIMAALLCGDDLERYARPPYGGDFQLELSGGSLFEELMRNNDTMIVDVLPPLGRLVGGDVAAGLFALNAYGAVEAPFLFIDIGTNIETVLVTNEALFVGSAPAGSTFSFEGIEGSQALESAVYLLEQGALLKTGLLDEAHPLVAREQGEILVAQVPNGPLTQLDVRAIQLARAAMSVSIAGVIQASRVNPLDIAAVYFGGAFSGHIADVIEPLALLPGALYQNAEFKFCPDIALEGALKLAHAEAARMTYEKQIIAVDFVKDPNFMQSLLAHLNFQ